MSVSRSAVIADHFAGLAVHSDPTALRIGDRVQVRGIHPEYRDEQGTVSSITPSGANYVITLDNGWGIMTGTARLTRI